MTSPRRALAHGLPLSPLAILCALTLYTSELASQPGGTVTGTVTAANKMAIPQARVRLVGTTLAAVTQADGTFQVAPVPVGRQTLEITMIGYTPKMAAIVIAAGETLNVVLALEPLPLEPVTVKADANAFAGMSGFEERRARGTGRYFTRTDIDRIQPRVVTDLLRQVPGMHVESGNGAFSGGSTTARAGRNGGNSIIRTCSMTYYMNGSPFALSNDIPINHYIAPDDIAAIEVYTGSSQIPPQFNSSLHNSSCGVVAIWTRSNLGSLNR